MFEFGTSIKDITPNVDGVGMLGWGRMENTVQAVGMPLVARAFVFRDSKTGKKAAYVVCEITFITLSIKKGVIDLLTEKYPHLGLTDENVMISATHTHSSPGGYSHYLMYNLTIPGYSHQVLETYVRGITEALVEADQKLEPAHILLNSGEISPEKNVAFNRSIDAYNENPEIEKVSFEDRNLAVDREMTLLRMESESGIPLGMLNWFAVHCTSIHSDNYLIHPDNKGCAAADFEKIARFQHNNPGFVGAFAQSSCGDVTPNFQFFPNMKFCRGQYEDDYQSAKFNGKIQAEKARDLFYNQEELQKMLPEIDYIHLYVDFSNVEVDPQFAEGKENQTTGKAIIGLSMLLGTAEGPGITQKLCSALGLLSNTISLKDKLLATIKSDLKKLVNAKKEIHGNKILFVETGEKRILGTSDIKNLIIPDWADPLIGRLRAIAARDAMGEQPWTPNILPVQILIIGNLAIAGIPAEFTTIAAKRLKETLLGVLEKRGVTKIVLSCYTNAYAGYVTTREEYEVQLYEGGSTHFGKWTLAAYQTKFAAIAEQLLKRPKERTNDKGPKPHEFSREMLEQRAFVPTNWEDKLVI
jgi:neutral ceramidase